VTKISCCWVRGPHKRGEKEDHPSKTHYFSGIGSSSAKIAADTDMTTVADIHKHVAYYYKHW